MVTSGPCAASGMSALRQLAPLSFRMRVDQAIMTPPAPATRVCGYRLRFARHGVRRTVPETYRTRADAARALEKMVDDGRADCDYDRRFRAMVLLATFASLRWGEVTALRRCDVDLEAGLVRVRMAFSD